MSGYSGARTTPSDKNNVELLRDNLMPYALADHMHERRVSAQLQVPVEFMPHVAPHFRGITLTANWLNEPLKADWIRARYEQRYAGEPLVDVVEQAPWVSRIAGRHGVEIGGFTVARAASAWWWWPPSTTCSRARPPGPYRTSTSRWACRNWPASRSGRTTPMADLLWQKPGVAVDAQIQRFLAGDDVILDREFFLYDIAASKLHRAGLQRIGILSRANWTACRASWASWPASFRSGAFVLDEGYEDGHSAIEARLTQRLGDAGRRSTPARSRSDQILVATRLWLKEKLARVAALSREVARVALDRAAARRSAGARLHPHPARRGLLGGDVVGRLGRGLHRRRGARCRHAEAGGRQPAGHRRRLRREPQAGPRAHHRRAGLRPDAGLADLRAQLSRGKFELAALEALGSATWTCAGSPGTCRCSPAPSSASSRCRRSTPPAARSCPTSAIPT